MNHLKSAQPDLSIVIPCFNEESGIQQTAQRVCDHLDKNHGDVSYELLLINDGSTDSTRSVIGQISSSNPRVRSLHFKYNQGRGAAIKKGISSSLGGKLILLDADLSYDVDHITDILGEFERDERLDIVVVSPYMKGGVVRGVPAFRLILSRAANWILASAFADGLSTVTCVVRGYRGDFIRSLPLYEDGKELHLEILRKASVLGARLVEIPGRLIWRVGKGARRKTSLKVVKAASRHFLYGVLMRPTQFFKYLSVLLLGLGLYEVGMLLGVFLDFYQAMPDFWLGVWQGLAKTFNHSPHTVVIASVALILGFQTLSFLVILQLLKLQQEETLRHVLAILQSSSMPAEPKG